MNPISATMIVPVSNEVSWLMNRVTAVETDDFAFYGEFSGVIPFHMVDKIVRWIESNGGKYGDGKTTSNYRLHIRMTVSSGMFTDEYIDFRVGVMKSNKRIKFIHVREEFALTETEEMQMIDHIDQTCKAEFITKSEKYA